MVEVWRRWRSSSELSTTSHFEQLTFGALNKFLSRTSLNHRQQLSIGEKTRSRLVFEAVRVANHSMLNGINCVHIRCSTPLFRLAASVSTSGIHRSITTSRTKPYFAQVTAAATRVDAPSGNKGREKRKRNEISRK